MTQVKASIVIDAPLEKVWNIISDLDSEPEFWKGTKNVKTLSQQGNKIKRKVVLAFRDAECTQDITLQPNKKIEIIFTTGAIHGTKVLQLDVKDQLVELSVIWDITMTGILKSFTWIVKNHVKKGTVHALNSIKNKAEE